MSDENKHKPLSSEELLALLNKKNNKEVNDLDDFEKEAFEGFSANVDPLKASELMDEVNLSVSKKVSNPEDKGSQKNRIIWFSAAASIVVIFLVTIFFVKQDNQKSATNLALNEPKNEQLVAPGMKPVEEAVVTGENVKSEPDRSSISQKQFNLPEKNPLGRKDELFKESLAESAPAFEQPSQIIAEGTITGETKNSKDGDVTVFGNVALTDKLEVKKKEQAAREESELDNGYSIAQTTSSIAMDESKETAKKADMDSKNSEKSYKNKSNSNEVVTVSAGAASKTSPAPSIRVNEETAYYTGGELAIKEFVKTNLKADKNSTEIVGRYKVKATVSAEGNLKVKSVVQISNEVCNCTDKIEKTLNTMKNWHPASINGKKTSSEVEFVIVF